MIIACYFLFFITACDRYTRYEVLTFFFTGVPPYGSEAQSSEADTDRLSGREILERRKQQYIVPSFAHGPFAAQQCNQCHSTSTSATFRSFSQVKTDTGGTSTGAGISMRLVLPIKKLCIDCHTSKSVRSAFNRGFWINGPVSDGKCTVCHSPHASPYPYMLRKGTSEEMCSSCHTEEFILQTEEHTSEKDCTECHNPHIGKDRFLLKKDFDESSLW